MKSKSTTPVLPPRLRVSDAAAYLGVTIWRRPSLAWDRTVPARIDGQRLLFDVKDLDAYADSLREVGA